MKSTHLAVKEAIKRRDEKTLKRCQEVRGVGPHGELAYVIQWGFDHEEHISDAQ